MTENARPGGSIDYRTGIPETSPADATGRSRRSTQRTIAVIGLGYVGLPTALAAHERGARILGVDVSESRLRAIRSQRVDLVAADRERLTRALDEEGFDLTTSSGRIGEADAVLICVPTPVDEHRNPDMRALQGACATVVENARSGQTIVLTSTSYPGTTRDLLAGPLAARGLTPGEDVYVAFSPERIDPGNTIAYRSVPRVVGGVTAACTSRAAALLDFVSDRVIPVSSAEAAEMSKLLENSFRAVNIAFANEFSDACSALSLDVREIVDAAATKPYGYMPFYPGAGVGGHCIPCDPHYLLWELRSRNSVAPILTEAMEAIAARPYAIVEQVVREMSAAGRGVAAARILVVGIAYKPGVEDIRESPAVRIVQELLQRDAEVDFHDPLVPSLRVDEHRILLSVSKPNAAAYDAIVVNTLHPGVDYGWLSNGRAIIDPSGRIAARERKAARPTEIGYPRLADQAESSKRRVAESKVPIGIDS